MQEIILQYTYPRLDAEVSKKRNHLLKAPFCIHPATGNICVPIDPARVHEFDPNGVPTIHKLIEELDNVVVEDGADGEHHSGTSSLLRLRMRWVELIDVVERVDWEHTSLKPYVQMMDKHAQGLMREVRNANKGELSFLSSR